MKKILFIDQFNKIGGGQSVLLDLVAAANAKGLKTTIALPRGDYVEANAAAGTGFFYLPQLKLTNGKKSVLDLAKLIIHYLSLFRLVKTIKQHDYVYVNGPRYFMFIYLLSFFVKRKFIYHIHIDFTHSGKLLLQKIVDSPQAYKIVFNSNYILETFLESANLKCTKSSKLLVIEPSLSATFSNLEFEDRFSEPKDSNYSFVCIGRIIPEKGFDTYLNIALKYPDIEFYIIGDAEVGTSNYYQSLRNRATANVIFTGKSTNVSLAIKSKGVQFSIVPSQWNEPFGIVAIEAMACSCITFVANRGGLVEIASHTGAVNFKDEEDLVLKIDSILKKSGTEKLDIAYAQYLKTQAKYNFENFSAKFSNLIQ
ncbi:glycosyltransferase involved in cell wall biosynthesis [Mucilaginibacter gracilis]|uniref:Glycosyltransferase involved in cell wall biosynthesis n=1 Tax=Mucilaginibacter gracilis TaxID=423350 RepID=A0A495IWL5_9SPHI|nr:glycosyltransferase family 4 protein [Mucilaginibacter gracilis]RKR81075.1 glycosyltransferase involved in cell wall biosynthesis [Mucilaginibacter gracilis]